MFGKDVYVFTVKEVLEKLAQSKTNFEILVTDSESATTLEIAEALGLSKDKVILTQELFREYFSPSTVFKQSSYSMPEKISKEWLEAGIKWDSIKYRAQTLMSILTTMKEAGLENK